MKKQSKSKKNSKHSKPKDQTDGTSNRRKFLASLGYYAIGGTILAGTGGVWAYSINTTLVEQDLSRIGQGQPTVVQIHDPNCSMCRNLQRNTRDALANIGDGHLEYVVANITTNEGQAFAARYGVSHVTLLLFDRNGKMLRILEGTRSADELAGIFQRYLGR